MLYKKICFSLFNFNLSFEILIKRSNNKWPLFNSSILKQITYLSDKFIFFTDLIRIANDKNKVEILDYMHKCIPLINHESVACSHRNILLSLKEATKDPKVNEYVDNKIAEMNLFNGVPDRAVHLLSTSNNPGVISTISSEIEKFSDLYGYNIFDFDSSCSDRGSSLVYFFQNHSDLISNKVILHFSPEYELENWFRKANHALGCHYSTSNIEGDNFDLNLDITSIDLPNESVDFVICHRVLEHVYDDFQALTEVHRILRKTGVLQISVPMTPQLKKTLNWYIPDRTHADHLRQYGADFECLLHEAGFTVNEEKWFLEQSVSKLVENNSYPLKMYHAFKN